MSSANDIVAIAVLRLCSLFLSTFYYLNCSTTCILWLWLCGKRKIETKKTAIWSKSWDVSSSTLLIHFYVYVQLWRLPQQQQQERKGKIHVNLHRAISVCNLLFMNKNRVSVERCITTLQAPPCNNNNNNSGCLTNAIYGLYMCISCCCEYEYDYRSKIYERIQTQSQSGNWKKQYETNQKIK